MHRVESFVGVPGYGEVAWDTAVLNQHGGVDAACDVLTMMANTPGVNGAPA